MTSRVVHVDIHGQRYAVRSDLDPQYIGELAGYLDEKMRLAARELASADPLRVAVIAALNIADELFRARANTTGADGRVASRAPPTSNGSWTPSSTTPARGQQSVGLNCRVIPMPMPVLIRCRCPCFVRDGSECRLSRCFTTK